MAARSHTVPRAQARADLADARASREHLTAAVSMLVQRFGAAAVAAEVRAACGDRGPDELASTAREAVR